MLLFQIININITYESNPYACCFLQLNRENVMTCDYMFFMGPEANRLVCEADIYFR